MRTPLIRLSEEFFKQTTKEQITYLHQLASSNNQALDLMQQERNTLRDENTLLKAELTACTKALDIQKNIVREHLLTSNAERQNLIAKIQQLSAKLKEQAA